MDGHRFDDLTRALAGSASRRSLLKTGVAGALAWAGARLGLDSAAAAAACLQLNHLCPDAAACCSGVCMVGRGPVGRCSCPDGFGVCHGVCVDPANAFLTDVRNCGSCGHACRSSRCGPAICVDGVCGISAKDCSALDGGCTVGICTLRRGDCEARPANEGGVCDADGSLCTVGDVCKRGKCLAGAPRVCAAPDQCRRPGVCDPATGVCTYEPLADGTACDDGNACTKTDVCRAGVCVGGNPVVCANGDQCRDAGTCIPATGECGDPTAKADGSRCSDDNGCTDTDTCQAGLCTPGTVVTCRPVDACHGIGVCDPRTGECSNPKAVDGQSCPGSNPCFLTSVCANGVCVGDRAVACTPQDGCHDVVCNPVSGECLQVARDNGATCAGADSCLHYSCTDGVCNGAAFCFDPQVCQGGECCTPNGKVPTDGSHCCTNTQEFITGFCICQSLGFGCQGDGDCCSATTGGCCGDLCVDLDSDPLNCGTCGRHIPVGAVCTGGAPDCIAGGFEDVGICGDRCLDLAVELENCGSCGHVCDIGSEVCAHGHCCPVGFDWTGSRCCPIGFHETNGACCSAGLTSCSGSCVALDVDLDNCGNCGVSAPTGGVCLGGTPQCTPGFSNDNGRCCRDGSHNGGGQCCVNGFEECGGVCISTSSDPLNCGRCGRHCGIGNAFCVSGQCCSVIGECS